MIINPAQLNDLPDLLIIETISFVQPWSKADFLSELGKIPPVFMCPEETPQVQF